MNKRNTHTICLTWNAYRKKHHLQNMFLLFLCAIVLLWTVQYWNVSANYRFSTKVEENVEKGTPESIEETYAYSALEVEEGYTVKLCGTPKIEGKTVYFYLTNPKENDILFRCEVMNQEERLLGSSGIIKPGYYCPFLELKEEITSETPITLRIIAYDAQTKQSRGTIHLNIS